MSFVRLLPAGLVGAVLVCCGEAGPVGAAGTNSPPVPAAITTNAPASTAAPTTNAPPVPTQLSADQFFERGVTLLREKSYAAAAAAFQSALAGKPDFVEAHANLAVSLVQLGKQAVLPKAQLSQYQAAAEHFSRAAELKPKDKVTYLLWAETLVLIGDLPLDGKLRLGCYQGAVEKCRQAAAAAPDDWEAYNAWAVILSAKLVDFAVNDGVRLSLYKEAAELFGKAVERAVYSADLAAINGNCGNALVRAARLTSDRAEKEALLREALKKYERSTRAVQKSARIWAAWGSATIELGKLTRGRNDLREGVERLNTSLSLSPDDAATLYTLACGYTQMGNNILAVESLKRCFEVDKSGAYVNSAPQDPDLAGLRGVTAFQELFATYNRLGIPAYNPPLRDSPR